MNIAVMQPYLFPYIGYFQLIQAADRFIFYDDVDFITRGWINRNNILINGKANLFTVPLRKASQNKLINEIEVAMDDRQRKKFLKKIYHAYTNAPEFDAVYPLIERTFTSDHETIADLAIRSVEETAGYLGQSTEFYRSSERFDNRDLDAADRLIDITRKEGGDTYINPEGGRDLYDKPYFEKHGVELRFLKPACPPYQQFDHDFVPWLSIIDILMFNEPDAIAEMLTAYELD